jgi:hypothetical protein
MSGKGLRVLDRRARKIPSEYRITLALCPTVTCLAPVGTRVLERETDDPVGAHDADRFERDPGVIEQLEPADVVELSLERGGVLGSAFELDPLIEVLGVLPHDHEVDVVVARRDAR